MYIYFIKGHVFPTEQGRGSVVKPLTLSAEHVVNDYNCIKWLNSKTITCPALDHHESAKQAPLMIPLYCGIFLSFLYHASS